MVSCQCQHKSMYGNILFRTLIERLCTEVTSWINSLQFVFQTLIERLCTIHYYLCNICRCSISNPYRKTMYYFLLLWFVYPHRFQTLIERLCTENSIGSSGWKGMIISNPYRKTMYHHSPVRAHIQYLISNPYRKTMYFKYIIKP